MVKKYLALVVGNSRYGDCLDLKNPGNDATDIASTLHSFGWVVTQLRDANREQFMAGLAHIQNRLKASPGAVVLVNLAGMGVQVSGNNYFLPVGPDYRLFSDQDIMHQTIRLDEIRQMLENFDPGTILMLLYISQDNLFSQGISR